jgi:sulfide dehydrogenase cytochrome subunit
MKLLIIALLGLAASIPALALENGQRLYASCAGCHGTAGAGAGVGVGGPLPMLAGQPKGALAASMRAFRSGARPATIMQQIAKGYTDEQVEQIAAYLAAQPKGAK